MTLPRIHAGDRAGQSLDADSVGLKELASAVHEALKNYPHYAIVTGYPATEESDHVVNLAHAICDGPGADGAAPRCVNKKVSFTRVRIDEQKAKRGGTATHYSRTHQPLAPHTDSSYKPEPHELVIFQMIVSDDRGGDSVMVPVEDLLARLSEETIACLREPVYPLGEETHPILRGGADDCEIRYYRNQIDRSLQEGTALSERQMAALTELDALLAEEGAFDQFHLKSGEILFFHNRKVLHGRTGFADDSKRELYRYRLNAPGLRTAPPPSAATGRCSRRWSGTRSASPRTCTCRCSPATTACWPR